MTKNRKLVFLVVDDSEIDYLMLKESNEELNSIHNIKWINDEDHVIDAISEHILSSECVNSQNIIMILDINMPKKTGIECLREIRTHSNEFIRRIPVIMLSTSDADSDINDSYSAGANAYISKPLTIMEYKNILRSLTDFWSNITYLPRYRLA